MKKINLLMAMMSLLSVFLLPELKAQKKLFLQDDTLSLGEVKVIPEKPDGAAGFKVSNIDKDLLKSIRSNSIANSLSIVTPMYIKTYGEGGTASSSFRGMGASHTQVLWEGIRIDNPMTGQTDLSTLITAFIDDVTLYTGGTPMSFGNRGAGGTVAIGSEPQWDKGVGLGYMQRIASFSNFTENLDFSTSSNRISYRLRAYSQKSENNYEYNDIYGSGDVLKRAGTSSMSRGMMHELNIKTSNTLYGAKLWYNFSDRELPGSIEYPTIIGNEKQNDESIRGILSFTSYYNKGEITGKMAYNSDWMHYENNMWSTNSRNQVNSVNGRLIGSYIISEKSIVNFGLDLRTMAVKTNNYEQDIKRKQASAEVTYNVLLFDRLGLFTSLNQEILDKDFLRISPSAGFDLALHGSKDYHLKGTLGLSNHLPTLNDLYWVPGGNPDLETEQSTNMEASFTYRDVVMSKLIVEGSFTGYKSVINDMIQWVPVSEFVWSPQNVVEVLSEGVEIDQRVSYSYADHLFKLIGSYYYTSVKSLNAVSDEDNSVGKQLIYVPKHKASISAIYKIKDFMISWNSLFTGERFITGDNSDSLPSYWLSNASLQHSLNIRNLKIDAGLSINNIFSRDYQSVKNYPMPWRSYILSLSIEFNAGK